MTSYTSDITNGANQSPSLNGFIGTNLIRSEKHKASYAKLRQEYDSCEKCCSSLFRAVKKGKDLIPSGGYKIHKISKQLLSFDIIRIRSRCHYYDVNLTPKFSLALKKCGHTSQWFLLGVNLLHDIYTVTRLYYVTSSMNEMRDFFQLSI